MSGYLAKDVTNTWFLEGIYQIKAAWPSEIRGKQKLWHIDF